MTRTPREQTESPRITDTRGVSPVIGVVLMVAVVVILAAIVGAGVLGLGDPEERAPQVSLDVTVYDDGSDAGEVVFVHRSGEPLHADRTKVRFRRGSDRDVVEPSPTDATLSAGETTTYNVWDNDWSGEWSVYPDASVHTLSDPKPDEEIRVTVIDVESNKVVYDRVHVVQTRG